MSAAEWHGLLLVRMLALARVSALCLAAWSLAARWDATSAPWIVAALLFLVTADNIFLFRIGFRLPRADFTARRLATLDVCLGMAALLAIIALDVALLPVNGLRIRVAGNKQVVMNAEEAAELTAALRPKLAVPQHYAFTGGTIGNILFLKSDKGPAHFVEAARRLVPDVPVKVISPGEPLTVAP